MDSAGIGYYMAKHLADLGFPAREVNVGHAASDAEKYANLKAEYYWGLRMRFQGGAVAGLKDERAISQLAGILYKHDARGRITIESKDEVRKRGVKSPDRTEAVMLTFAEQPLGWRLVMYETKEEQGHMDQKAPSPFDQQLQRGMPQVYETNEDGFTCKECAHRTTKDGDRGPRPYCSQRRFYVKDQDVACAAFELRD